MNIEQAKRIRLEDFLHRLGYSPNRRSRDQLWFSSPFRNEQVPSFKLNLSLNTWYDFGLGEGGDIIDFVKQHERISTVSDALSRIDAIIGAAPLPPRATFEEVLPANGPALELSQIGEVRSKSLLAYLHGRGIDPASVKPHVEEAHYRNGDRSYFALAFPNNSGGYELRNPLFKGTLGPKDFTIIRGNPRKVLVFEGFFDFLSFASLPVGLPEATSIVLNSASMKDKAITAIRNLAPECVELYLDRDPTGEHLAQSFLSALPGTKIIDKSAMYVGFNDLNEWHVANSRSQPPRRFA